MNNKKHYVIGDIHGEYKTLLALLKQIPQDAKLIFVGDLISRGSQSREVINFVRKSKSIVVKGNHEEYLLKFGSLFLEMIENQKKNSSLIWGYTSLSSTLRSFGLLEIGSSKVIVNHEAILELKEAMEWIETLPCYYELGHVQGYMLPVIITHAPVDKYWLFKDSFPDYFNFLAMNNRYPPSRSAPIFNIYGHIPQLEVVFGVNYVSLDTGCGRGSERVLSSYCIESKEVLSVTCVV